MLARTCGTRSANGLPAHAIVIVSPSSTRASRSGRWVFASRMSNVDIPREYRNLFRPGMENSHSRRGLRERMPGIRSPRHRAWSGRLFVVFTVGVVGSARSRPSLRKARNAIPGRHQAECRFCHEGRHSSRATTHTSKTTPRQADPTRGPALHHPRFCRGGRQQRPSTTHTTKTTPRHLTTRRECPPNPKIWGTFASARAEKALPLPSGHAHARRAHLPQPACRRLPSRW